MKNEQPCNHIHTEIPARPPLFTGDLAHDTSVALPEIIADVSLKLYEIWKSKSNE